MWDTAVSHITSHLPRVGRAEGRVRTGILRPAASAGGIIVDD